MAPVVAMDELAVVGLAAGHQDPHHLPEDGQGALSRHHRLSLRTASLYRTAAAPRTSIPSMATGMPISPH